MGSFDLGGVQKQHTPKPPPPDTSKKWSPQQTAIFDAAAGDGHIVAEACAGTGKTTTGVEMLKYLAGKVVMCAFNKRIADELGTRVSPQTAKVSTLHGLGFGFARRLGYTVVDDKRGFRIAEEALVKAHLPISRDGINAVQKTAAMCKEVAPYADCVDDVERVAQAYGTMESIPPQADLHPYYGAVLVALELALRKDGQLDFSDMLYLPLRLGVVTPTYDVVVVDETQDMNFSQLELAQKMMREDARIIALGDPRQAIYGFRGADSGSMERLTKKFSATVLPLSVTYRCPKKIVEVAQGFVPHFTAHESAPEGEVREVRGDAFANEVQPGDFVLSRTNAPLLRACLTLVKQGKRAKVEGREIGKGLVGLVQRQKARDVDELLDCIEEWEYVQTKRAGDNEARLNYVHDQAEAVRTLAEEAQSIQHVCDRALNLFADTGNSKDTVVCSTVHKSKGLESERVFILCETFRSQEWASRAVNEENNLKYVAVTRSKGQLIWVDPKVDMPGMPKKKREKHNPIQGTENADPAEAEAWQELRGNDKP